MAKKHQVKISKASTRRSAGRKWRRQAKASLKQVVEHLDLRAVQYGRPAKPKVKASKLAKQPKQPKVRRPKQPKAWAPSGWLNDVRQAD